MSETQKKGWLIQRLDEPSTWAGIGLIFATVAPFLEAAAHVSGWPGIVLTIVSAVQAVVKAESKP